MKSTEIVGLILIGALAIFLGLTFNGCEFKENTTGKSGITIKKKQ